MEGKWTCPRCGSEWPVSELSCRSCLAGQSAGAPPAGPAWPPAGALAPPPAYSDQGTWLTIIGLLFFGLAACCVAGMVMVFAVKLPNAGSLFAVYLGGLAVLATLGTGLLRKRRWARAVTMASSWSMAASTTLSVIVMFLSLASTSERDRWILFIACGAMAGFGGVLPAGVALFLASRDARMTCEWHDQEPSWTDRHSVLSMVLIVYVFMNGLGSFSAVIGPPSPFCGVFLPETLARTFMALLALAWLAIGAGLAARREAAWWAALALALCMGVSNVFNAFRVTMEEMYTRAGMTAQQISAMKGFSGNWHALMIVPSVGFVVLILAERYFRRPVAAEGAGPASA
jgi:hypothetical protein